MPPQRDPAPIDNSRRLRLDPTALRKIADHLSFEGPVEFDVQGWSDISDIDDLLAIPDRTVKRIRMASANNSVSVTVDRNGYEYRAAKVWEPDQEKAFEGVRQIISASALYWRPVRFLLLLASVNLLALALTYVVFQERDQVPHPTRALVPLALGIVTAYYAQRINRPRIILHPERMGIDGLESWADRHKFIANVLLVVLAGMFTVVAAVLGTLVVRS